MLEPDYKPWASVRRALARSYVGFGTLVAIVTYGHMELVAKSDSLDRCLERFGWSTEARTPALVGYLVYKAAFWPVSLGWTMIEGEVRPIDWGFGRYDPFAGTCQPISG